MKKYAGLFSTLFILGSLFIFFSSALANTSGGAPDQVNGHVYHNGSAVDGAKVKIFRNGVLKATVLTNANGFYTAGGSCADWPSGIYVVKASYKQPGQPAVVGQTSVTKPDCNDVTAPDIHLSVPN